MREHQRNGTRLGARPRVRCARWMVVWMAVLLTLPALGAHAQTVPEVATYEGSFAGYVMTNLNVAGVLHIVTREGVYAYEPAPSPTHPRGRFRVLMRGDFFTASVANDQLYFRMRDTPSTTLYGFRGAEHPIETIPTSLGPPLALGTVDGQPCIAGEHILTGSKAGTVEPLARCLPLSELWPAGVVPTFVHVFDGRVLYLVNVRAASRPNTLVLWAADGVKPPYVVHSFAEDRVLGPLALDDALLFHTAPWASGAAGALHTLARGSASLVNVGAFSRAPYKPAMWLRDAWLYVASTPASGEELWRTDGTAAGTRQVAELAPGAASSAPELLGVLGSALYFTADGWEGRELHRSDGTSAGTTLVEDRNPRGGSYVRGAVVAGDRLYFACGSALCEIDGTAAGMHTLPLSPRHGGDPEQLVAVGDALYFHARDLLWPKSLWRLERGKITHVAAPISELVQVVDGDPTEKWIDYDQRELTDAAGDVGASDRVDYTSAEITASGDVAYLRYTTTAPVDLARMSQRYLAYFDADRDASTGYVQQGPGVTVGAEYLLMGERLYRYAGAGTDARWAYLATAKAASRDRTAELSFDTSTFDPPLIGSAVLLRADNDDVDDFLY